MSVSGPRWSRRDLLGASASLALGLSLESPGAAADAAATPEEAPQQRRSGASRPNIILFVPDEMRADTGVAPTKRDRRGAAVLDRSATLEHVAPVATLLDH